MLSLCFLHRAFCIVRPSGCENSDTVRMRSERCCALACVLELDFIGQELPDANQLPLALIGKNRKGEKQREINRELSSLHLFESFGFACNVWSLIVAKSKIDDYNVNSITNDIGNTSQGFRRYLTLQIWEESQ